MTGGGVDGTLAVSFFASTLSGAGATGAGTEAGFGALADPGGFGGADGGFEGGLGTLTEPGGLGGAEAEGGVPPACTGFGGRLTIALSRGVDPVGLPSRRGGRTILTVSFLG